MKNRILKYSFITLAFFIALQVISIDEFVGKVSKESTIKIAPVTVRLLQSDLDDSPPSNFIVFHSTFLNKQFFNRACSICEGTISNPGSQTLNDWVTVKLQV